MANKFGEMVRREEQFTRKAAEKGDKGLPGRLVKRRLSFFWFFSELPRRFSSLQLPEPGKTS